MELAVCRKKNPSVGKKLVYVNKLKAIIGICKKGTKSYEKVLS